MYKYSGNTSDLAPQATDMRQFSWGSPGKLKNSYVQQEILNLAVGRWNNEIVGDWYSTDLSCARYALEKIYKSKLKLLVGKNSIIYKSTRQ